MKEISQLKEQLASCVTLVRLPHLPHRLRGANEEGRPSKFTKSRLTCLASA